MAAIYEFHVAGLVGPVIRSALPEMKAFEKRSGRTMHGTAAERCEIDRLLELIQMLNLTVHRLQISVRRDDRSGLGDHVPVVDDRGAQDHILE
jgi:hypothetical protein